MRYIISDLKKFRNLYHEDDGEQVGGMIICDSSEQARALYGHFMEIQMELNEKDKDKSAMKPALILWKLDFFKVFVDFFKLVLIRSFNFFTENFQSVSVKNRIVVIICVNGNIMENLLSLSFIGLRIEL